MNNLITLPVWRITPMLMGSLCVFAWLDNRCFGKDAPMLVIIDETVANCQAIAVAVRPGVEVVVVKQATDFIGEATRLLTERPDVTELHIVSHGEPGKVHLGRHPLTVDDVWRRRAELAKWFAGRSGSAAIFLYGCEVGAGREGEQFVEALKSATGAQVAASTNLTGSSRLGGDWALELATGDIATSQVFDRQRLDEWGGVLASVYINEILFNPPSTLEDPNEYIEIRGAPNYIIPTNTYLVSVDGDNDTDPNNSDVGKIKNIFPLGGVPIGNNGFLILLQKSNTYAVNTNATKLQNNGSQWGWGNATESSIGQNGRKDGTNLVNASVTFLLITTPVAPSTNDVVDTDGDGVLDGVSTNWTILDSVGILDKTTNTTDYAYGLINFKNTNGIGIARSGTIVTNKWTANYVGRNTNNTTGYGTNDWVASDVLKGTAPNYSLNGTNTTPAYRVNASLNHIGGPNFGSSLIPGIKLVESSGSTAVTEGLTNLDTYTLELNSTPTNGAVVIEARADGQVQVSTNGVSFSNRCAVSITNANSLRKVYVRPIDDNLVEGTPHYGFITHAVTNTTDTFNYPTSSIIPTVTITITDNEGALLSEVDVNPPGSPDA